MTEERYTFDKNEVKKLKISTAFYPTTIEEVEGLEEVVITVNGDNDRFPYKCEIKEGKVRFKFKNKSVQFKRNEFKEYRESGAFVRVEIPANMTLEKVKIEVDAGTGTINLPTLVATETKITSGAGEMEICSLHTVEKATFEIGAGKASVKNFVAEDDCKTTIQCGVGELSMEANGLGSYEIDCGVGSSTLRLDAPEAYYNIDLSCGLGSISLNGAKQGGIFGTHSEIMATGATHTLSASCGLGKLQIYTA